MTDDKRTSLHVIDHGDGTRTVRARYLFRAKEYGDGTTWLVLESWDAHIPPIERANGVIGFDLKDGTTIEQARELASLLNGTITTMSYTGRQR